MTDLKNDLRELFHDREADVHPAHELPVQILRRSRRRRLRTVVVATATAVVVAFGVVTGAGALLAERRDVPGSGSTATVRPVSRSVSPAGAATGQAVTIAKGTVHPGGEWELTVSDDAYGPPSGPSLDFRYVGSERTSLGLAPLDGKVFGPARTGSHTSGNTVNDPLLAIWGLVSGDVHDVTFVRSDGTTYPGQLPFQMPSSIVGPAQAFIIFVTDGTRSPTGTLVAFDTAGNQLATLNLG